MSSVLEHINRYSGAYAFFSSVVLTVITAIYVMLTRSLVNESRRIRMLQTEPQLQVSLVPSRSWSQAISMEIANIGSGGAYDVRLKSHPEAIRINAGQPQRELILMSQFGPFKYGIPFLASHSVIEINLQSLTHGWRPPTDELRITATYKTADGQTRDASYTLGFLHLDGVAWPAEGVSKVAEELSKLVQEVRAIARG